MNIAIPEIPHGHGLSFKKGLSDGLLDTGRDKETCHETHRVSYLKGYDLGVLLRTEIAKHVKA